MVERGTTGVQPGAIDSTLVVASETKYSLELLAETGPQRALVVACERSATAVLEEWRRVVGALEDVAVVVVGDDVRSGTGSQNGSAPLGNAVTSVPGYDDTASLTAAVSGALRELRSGGRSPTVYVESLTAFERRLSLSRFVVTVGRLSNAIRAANARGHFLVDPSVDGEIRGILGGLVSRTVEVDDGERTVVERDGGTPSVDTIHDLLASAERRFVLRRLAATDGPVPVDDLAEELAAVGDSGETVRASVALYHMHLPPLDEADVVAFDREAGIVETGTAFDDVRPYLRLERV